MNGYIEYDMGDGTVLVVETSDDYQGGVTKASLGGGLVNFSTQSEVEKKLDFESALAGAKKSIMALKKMFEEAQPDEVEVTFGLKAVGEAGGFAIAKASVEVNYQVTMKWKNPSAAPAPAGD